MDSFINKLTEEYSIKPSDYTVFDIANPSDGLFYTSKISYYNLTNQISSDIYSVFKTIIDSIQTNLNTANTNIANKLDKRGLSFTSDEEMSGDLYINSALCAAKVAYFSDLVTVKNNFISDVKNPVLPQDAVNLRSLTAVIDSLVIPNGNDYIKRSGDQMTSGFITAATEDAPTDNKHLTNKKYVDQQVSGVDAKFNTFDTKYIKKIGDTMTGSLILTGVPTINNEASTKKYVDDSITTVTGLIPTTIGLIRRTGDTMTGSLILTGAPTINNEASNKQYVDNRITTVTGLIPNVAGFVTRIGDTMTGSLILTGAPTIDNEASNKKYVDQTITSALNNYPTSLTVMTTYVKKSGDTMTGSLYLNSDPTNPSEAATKRYVDGQITNIGSSYSTKVYVDDAFLRKTGDIMTGGNLKLSAEPTDPKHATTKNYVDVTFLRKDGDVMTGGNLTLSAEPTDPKHATTKAYVDLFIKKSGDTMTAGNLTLSSEPTLDKHATTKTYVDSVKTYADTTFVKKVGDTMTAGNLTLSAEPTDGKHATTKTYVDGVKTYADTTFVKKQGDTMTAGNLTLSAEPTDGKHATTKTYVDGVKTYADTNFLKKDGDTMTGGNLTLSAEPTLDKHATTKTYVDGVKTYTNNTFLKKDGDTMTAGNLTLSAEPTDPKHATTKTYVDSVKTYADTNFLKKDGDTMTAGNLTLSAEPTDPKHATTKTYVDTKVSSAPFLNQTSGDTRYLKKDGDTMTGGNLTLSAEPTDGKHATTKTYVDNKFANSLTETTANNLYVKLSGDTMTGPLKLMGFNEKFGIIPNTHGSTVTLNTTISGNTFELNLGTNIAQFNVVGASNSGYCTTINLFVKSDGMSDITWSFRSDGGTAINVLWAGGVGPIVNKTVGSVDVFTITKVNNVWYGFVGGQNLS